MWNPQKNDLVKQQSDGKAQPYKETGIINTKQQQRKQHKRKHTKINKLHSMEGRRGATEEGRENRTDPYNKAGRSVPLVLGPEVAAQPSRI